MKSLSKSKQDSDIDNIILHFIWKGRDFRITKTALKNKNKMGGITLPDGNANPVAIAIKRMWNSSSSSSVGGCSKNPDGCLKPQILLKPICTVFSNTYVLMIIFNLQTRQSKWLTTITNNKVEQF